jgi:hypothetical protein
VGAKFLGWNKHGPVRWFTRCTVTRADRPDGFEFQVNESKMIWGYRFEADGEAGGSGTLVTEYRRHTKPVNAVIGFVQRSGMIGKDRDQLMVDGMRATLERLKAAAEAEGASR